MYAQAITQASEQLAADLTRLQLMMATAESCTGGGIAHALTALAGSSRWFERGFVTYSNPAKREMLGVPEDALLNHGAVSGETALAMAVGALSHSRADFSVAVTGIAGPDGATPGKPVGTVWIAWARRGGGAEARCFHFSGDRDAVRQQTILQAIQGLNARLQSSQSPPSWKDTCKGQE